MFNVEPSKESHSGRVLHQAESFRVVECADCGFAHLDPKPPAADLERFYQGTFYDEANPDYLAKTEREIAYWNRVVYGVKEGYLRNLLGGVGRVLDIGCCGGFFLRYFADRGWDVLGLEPGRSAYEWATQKSRVPVKQMFFELASEAELGLFDAVHLAFVMEHVREPKEFLGKIVRLLKPGGVVCIEVPNDFNPLQAVATAVLSKEPYWICAPDHINYFTFDSLEALLENCGLRVLRRDATFPLELFLLMGDDYVGNESVGLACHERRMRMEERLYEGGAGELLEAIYADLARRGLGRQAILYAQKPERSAVLESERGSLSLHREKYRVNRISDPGVRMLGTDQGVRRMAEPRSRSPMIVLGGGPSQEIFLQDLYARYGDFTLLDVNQDAPGRQWAERFFHASIYDFGACQDALAAFVTPDSRVMTFATGPAGEVCYRLCRAFELPRRSGTLAAAANNKKLLADILGQNGLRVPRQIVLNEAGFDPALLESMTFPAVLKPIQAGGGQGVRILEGRDQAIGLCRQLRRPFLLQEKLSGREELLWLIVRQGRIVALLHGQNLFDESTGWHSPLGLAIERIPLQHGIPLRWTKLASQLIDVFNLRDDSIVAELIADDRGDTIIDVELNGLSAFACSKVLEGNLLTSLLVDTYLQRDFSGPKTAGWVSCMAFFAAPEPAALTQMARKATRIGSCVVEPPRNVSKLVCFDTTVYKGGYLIITEARDLTEAAAKARAILVEAAA